jgi:hypothetical protein
VTRPARKPRQTGLQTWVGRRAETLRWRPWLKLMTAHPAAMTADARSRATEIFKDNF